MRRFYVYIMTNRSKTLYVGVTNHLARRVQEHKEGRGSAFTSCYRINQLVYCEVFTDIRSAILREKQIKGWTRVKKIALIESLNPDWRELRAE